MNSFVKSERAVSPVIGVILLVGITVILAAVIGVFVLGQGNSMNESSGSYSIDTVEQNGEVEITFEAVRDAGTVDVIVDDEVVKTIDSPSSGDTIVIAGVGEGVEVSLVESTGSSSSVVAEHSVKDGSPGAQQVTYSGKNNNAANGGGDVLVVDKSNSSNYDVIQNAVDDSSAKDTVVVKEGTYTQQTTRTVHSREETVHVYVDKPITIRGEGDVVLSSDADSGGVVIRSNDVTVTGVNVTNAGLGIDAVNSDNLVLEDVAVKSSTNTGSWGGQSVYVSGSDGATISDVFIMDSENANSMSVYWSSDVLVSQGTIENSGYHAVSIWQSDSVEVKGFTTEESKYNSVWIGKSSDITVEQLSSMNEGWAGVRAGNSENVVFRNIDINNAYRSSMFVIGSTGVTFENTHIENSGFHGYSLDNSTDITMTDVSSDGAKWDGLWVSNATDFHVSNAEFVNGNSMMQLDGVRKTTITNVEGEGTEYGIEVNDGYYTGKRSKNVTFKKVEVVGSPWSGLRVIEADNVEFVDGRIIDVGRSEDLDEAVYLYNVTDIDIHQSQIVSSEVYVKISVYDTSETINATRNWFGDSTPEDVYSGTSDVDYDPWCTNAECTEVSG